MITSGSGYISLQTPQGHVAAAVTFERKTRRRWAYCYPTDKVLRRKYKHVLRWMTNIYADFALTVPVLNADDPDPKQRWWRSSGGALERVLTRLEATTFAPPRAGWTVVENAWAASGEYREGMPIRAELRSEMLEEGEARRAAAKMARLEERVTSARENLKRYERREKLAATLRGKWAQKLALRERALSNAKLGEKS
jgi:hypothetical protein